MGPVCNTAAMPVLCSATVRALLPTLPASLRSEQLRRRSSARLPAVFPLALAASQTEPRIWPPGTHLQPGITSDLRQF